MDRFNQGISRRKALALGASAAAASTFGFDLGALAQAANSVIKRPIPHSGEQLPIVGIGAALRF